MATDLVETRSDSCPPTLATAEFIPDLRLSTNQRAAESSPTSPGEGKTWFEMVLSVAGESLRAAERVLTPAPSTGFSTSTTSGPQPNSLGLGSVGVGIAEVQQSLIKKCESLWALRRRGEPHTEEEACDWEAFVEPPSHAPTRQITFHLVRRGYQQPRIVADSED